MSECQPFNGLKYYHLCRNSDLTISSKSWWQKRNMAERKQVCRHVFHCEKITIYNNMQIINTFSIVPYLVLFNFLTGMKRRFLGKLSAPTKPNRSSFWLKTLTWDNVWTTYRRNSYHCWMLLMKVLRIVDHMFRCDSKCADWYGFMHTCVKSLHICTAVTLSWFYFRQFQIFQSQSLVILMI